MCVCRSYFATFNVHVCVACTPVDVANVGSKYCQCLAQTLCQWLHQNVDFACVFPSFKGNYTLRGRGNPVVQQLLCQTAQHVSVRLSHVYSVRTVMYSIICTSTCQTRCFWRNNTRHNYLFMWRRCSWYAALSNDKCNYGECVWRHAQQRWSTVVCCYRFPIRTDSFHPCMLRGLARCQRWMPMVLLPANQSTLHTVYRCGVIDIC